MTKDPPRPSPATRRGVLARDGMVCQLCDRRCRTRGEIFGHGAHGSRPTALPGEDPLAEAGVLLLLPRGEGGTLDISNLVTACRGCSSSKGGRTVDRWRAAILRRWDWEETRL